MILEHERNHGLGMHALLSVCSWIMSGTMDSTWMHGRVGQLAVYTGGTPKVLENTPWANYRRTQRGFRLQGVGLRCCSLAVLAPQHLVGLARARL